MTASQRRQVAILLLRLLAVLVLCLRNVRLTPSTAIDGSPDWPQFGNAEPAPAPGGPLHWPPSAPPEAMQAAGGDPGLQPAAAVGVLGSSAEDGAGQRLRGRSGGSDGALPSQGPAGEPVAVFTAQRSQAAGAGAEHGPALHNSGGGGQLPEIDSHMAPLPAGPVLSCNYVPEIPLYYYAVKMAWCAQPPSLPDA